MQQDNTKIISDPTSAGPDVQPEGRKWIRTALAGLFILLIASASLVWYSLFVPLNAPEVIIRIKPGENTATIASQLKEKKVIRSELLFRIMAKLDGSDRHLKAGHYVFGGNCSLMQTLERIRSGRSTLIHLTIPEGFSLYKTIRQMERVGIGPYDSLLAIATDPSVVKALTGFDKPTLEGFLYPETYAFDIDIEPRYIFGMMTGQFFKKLAENKYEITEQEEFYRNLILASIVEQEAVLEREKPLIAGVFLNRLAKNMRLESCPSVDYILERQDIRRRQLTETDLQIDSPYNTYRIDGLPPNPICNPSISSLQAVYYPQVTDFLYFFADFEGNNIFSRTYTEHQNKMKIYNREL